MKERELFLAALDIEDPVARQAHLKVGCAGDSELLARVESLLASHAGQSQFLKTPAVEQIAEASDTGTAATNFAVNGSLQDDEPDATALHIHGPDAMTKPQNDSDDEIPLGYLEPSSRPDSLGRLGHYEVLEVIGRGAFGTVLRAFDEKLQRVVAIKVMAPELAATSPARKRFLREAQASAAIRHEHVVSIHAVEEKPIPYLVMEFIPGETLQHRLDERGPLDVLTVLRIGRQIAEGLAAAHAQDLIHRDIKPANILLESGAREMVKVTDFGLARAADDASLTQSGTIAGTPMYMAPEQALGHKLDQRADLFSFGSVLYQMVSGRPPFRAPTALAVLKRVAEEPPRPIQEIIPETPQWLCNIIARLHAKNPDDRYQSAREIGDLLGKCLADLQAHRAVKLPADLPLPSSLAPASIHTRNALRRAWPATAALVLLAVIGLGVTEMTGITKLFTTVLHPQSVSTGRLIIETDYPETYVTLTPRKDGWESLGHTHITSSDREEFVLAPGWYRLNEYKTGRDVSQRLVRITSGGTEVVQCTNGWGAFINPRNDSQRRSTSNGVSLTIPGIARDVNSPGALGNVDAPRLMQAVEGDFAIQVKVLPFDIGHPEPEVTESQFYRSAGLVVCDDEGTMLRHELGCFSNVQVDHKIILFSHWNQDGKTLSLDTAAVVAGPISLKIERHGDLFSLRWSDDGENWQTSEAVHDLKLPQKVQIGVLASNTTTTPLTATFEDLRIDSGLVKVKTYTSDEKSNGTTVPDR